MNLMGLTVFPFVASPMIMGIADLTEKDFLNLMQERKKLILLVRETPLSLLAIENMRKINLAGGTIMPACPGFYHKPKKVEEVIDFVVARVLDHLEIRHNLMKR